MKSEQFVVEQYPLRRKRTEPLHLVMVAIVAAAGMVALIEAMQRGMWPRRDPFWSGFLAGDIWPLWAMFPSLLLAIHCPLPLVLSRKLRRLGSRPLALAGVVLIALCLGTLFVYINHPHVIDEDAACFQSQVFASGHVTGSWPVFLMERLSPPYYYTWFLEASKSTGQVISAYWPGYSLIMAPFTAIGAPWACNPLLTSASIWLVYRITHRLAGESAPAAWAALLAVASPALTVPGISYYSTATFLCLNLLFAYLLILGGGWRFFLAGVAGSMALVASNPVPHMAFMLPWLIWVGLQPNRFRKAALLLLGYLPLTLLLGWGWVLLRTTIGRGIHVESAFALPTLRLLEIRVVDFAKIVAWEVPGLIALALFGTILFWNDGRIRALAGSATVTFLIYLVVPFNQGPGWGYRYFETSWGVLPILAGTLLGAKSMDWKARPANLPGLVGAAVLCSLLVLTPWRMAQVRSENASILRQELPHDPARPTVIFLDIKTPNVDSLIHNDPFLRDPVLRLVSEGRLEDAQLMKRLLPAYIPKYYSTGSVWTDPGGSGNAPWAEWSPQ
jgi:hypothetical protein